MKITKPERFPVEFSTEELVTLNKAVSTLDKIMKTLEENDLSVLQNSCDGNCLDMNSISRIHDELMDLSEMDEAF